RHQNSQAIRTEIRTGVSDGEWIEVTQYRVPAPEGASAADDPWVPIDGSEQAILGDLSILTDGGPVRVNSAKREPKVASAPPTPTLDPTNAAAAARERVR